MQVLFLVSVQLPVSSLGWPQFALWIDGCDPSPHQSDKKILSEISYIRTVLFYNCIIQYPKKNSTWVRHYVLNYGTKHRDREKHIFPRHQCSLDSCIKMVCSPSFSQVPFDVSIGAAFEEPVFPPPTSPFQSRFEFELLSLFVCIARCERFGA